MTHRLPLYQTHFIHTDIYPVAGSSDGKSGRGCSMKGYDKVLVLGLCGQPSGDSDETYTLRVQYDSGSNVPSDCNSYANFSTNVTSGAQIITSDANNSPTDAGFGMTLAIDVDLAGHGMDNGCIRAVITNSATTATGPVSAVFIFYSGNFLGDFTQNIQTVYTFP